MRIAVVGSGIAGLAAAWLLGRRHQVTLYEAEGRLGGHTHTHAVQVGAQACAVDTGFIVFNPVHYPLLTRLFETLGVCSQPTTMSFGVSNAGSGLEYQAGSLRGLLARPANLLSPRFWAMLAGIRRFHREAPGLLADDDPGPTLEEYLRRNGYPEAFATEHLLPMACALWSTPAPVARCMPVRHLVRFMHNHCMLQVTGRPTWRVVGGGSQRYVDAITHSWDVAVRLSDPVLTVARLENDGVRVDSKAASARYDQVVLACHADDALRMLERPSREEREVLGAIGFQDNDVVLHTDARLLPRRHAAWAAWNVRVEPGDDGACGVSYWMNALQGLDTPEPLIVTLNRTAHIDPRRILARMHYRHPLFNAAAVRAQARRAGIDGRDRIRYCGAWWGFGFHEDGLRSAVEAAAALGVPWP